ncbi:MAG TPA: hypothetical protein V6D28_04050 [Leptolyngbyaceae cyanobacterium]
MAIGNLLWHDYLVVISFIGSIAGILLLNTGKQTQANQLTETEQMLMLLSFTCWTVYCFAVGTQKLFLPKCEIFLTNLQITAAIAYFLTFCCILSLPLHRFSVGQVEK